MKKRVSTKNNSKRAAARPKAAVKKTPTAATNKKTTRRLSAGGQGKGNKAAHKTLARDRTAGERKSREIASGTTTPESTRPRSVPESSDRKSAVVSGDERKAGRNGAAKRTSAQTKPSATSQDPIQFVEEQPREVKTHLTPKELREFKALLLAKRAELAGDVEHLTAEALNRKESGSGEQSTMPIHMADLGSDTWEQDFTLGLIANEQAVVREIDSALQRIANKTYGICEATDKPITRERLRAKPWAMYCIEYARLREEGRAP